MERKVIIRGHVFDYAEKAPFVLSGKSLFGAVEYDSDLEKVKCHECGEWFRYIAGTHLRFSHELSPLDYRLRHGINVRSPLCAPSFSVMRSGQHTPTVAQTAKLVQAGREYKRVNGNNLTNRNRPHYERANANSRCQAQTLFRMQVLAAGFGRTPTAKELSAAHIDQPLLVRNFGSIEAAMRLAELQPRPQQRPPLGLSAANTCPLPVGFPSKIELLRTKEPYFSTTRCSERGCIFPAGESGLCPQHSRMFQSNHFLISTHSSLVAR